MLGHGVQIVVGNEYAKAAGAAYGGSSNYDSMLGGNAFWIDGNTPTSATAPAQVPAAGGSFIDIKGWNLLPTDLDMSYDGSYSFTLANPAGSSDTLLSLTADLPAAFAVTSLAANDFLLLGIEIVQVPSPPFPSLPLSPFPHRLCPTRIASSLQSVSLSSQHVSLPLSYTSRCLCSTCFTASVQHVLKTTFPLSYRSRTCPIDLAPMTSL